MALFLAPISDDEFVPRVEPYIFTYRVVSETTYIRDAMFRKHPFPLTLSLGFGWYSSDFVREIPEEVVEMAEKMQREIWELDEEFPGGPEDNELPVDVVYVLGQGHRTDETSCPLMTTFW